MDFYPDNQNPRRKRGGALKQMAGVTLAAVFGSALTAGVLSQAWKPAPAAASTTAQAAATTQSAVSSNAALASAPASTVGSTTNLAAAAAAATDPDAIVEQIFKRVEPDVVAVVNYQNVSNFFTQQTSLQEYGVGSGVLFKKDSNYGYFVTNNHVVAGANKLEIVLYSGVHVKATLVGADPYTDLAVIKVPAKDLSGITPAQFANSNNIQPGQLAVAIGTPLGLNFAETVTSGIVSGKSRVMPVETPNGSSVLDYQDAIQTDAAINPGNSGGPLLNYLGQVVGINSSKIVQTGTQSMGFAIPSDEVKTVVQQLMLTGHMTHPALGITAYSLSDLPQQYWPNIPVNYGVYVYSVDSAGAKASGLKAGDVIVAVNGQTVQGEASLRTAIFALKPGTTVKLTVYRDKKKLTLSVKLGTLTAAAAAAASQSAPSSGGSSGSGFGSGFGNGFGGGYGSGSGSGAIGNSGTPLSGS